MSEPRTNIPYSFSKSGVQVMNIDASANSHSPTPSLPSRPIKAVPDSPNLTLNGLDLHLGALRIGQFDISREELRALGATVDGAPISPDNSNIQSPDQRFLDALSFDPAEVEARIRLVKNADSSIVAGMLFDLASIRTVGAPPVLNNADILPPHSAMYQYDKLLVSAQKIDIHRVQSDLHMPKWLDNLKGQGVGVAGTGLQAYGLYSGLVGITEAIKTGDGTGVAINIGGIATELTSLAIEVKLTNVGQNMLLNGSKVFRQFSGTTVGIHLGRSAGLLASIFTLPFDILSAVQSFNAAASAKGKEAQDHYVMGGVAVTSAGLSLALGLAAAAGYGAAAGPIGIAAAAVLIMGAQIYQAVRLVDNIDDYIELSAGESLLTGFLAFTGNDAPSGVMDRFNSAIAVDRHVKQTGAYNKSLLEGPYKHNFELIVEGNFKVELRPGKPKRRLPTLLQAMNSKSLLFFLFPQYDVANEATIIDDRDVYDIREGVPDVPGVTRGEKGPGKGNLLKLGNGDDIALGERGKPNYFTYGEGTKYLTGGEERDHFQFNAAATTLDKVSIHSISSLDGGSGNDSLIFQGRHPHRDTRHAGYNIDLNAGQIDLRSQKPDVAPVPFAQVTSIENVSTLSGGTSHVTGTETANIIAANGNDTIHAGAGDDSITVAGTISRIDGGTGVDHYKILESVHQVSIIEDGQDNSIIELHWTLECIQSWRIVDCSLIIDSQSGVDGELHTRTIIVQNVYRQVGANRQLQNSKLLVTTKDGFQISPVLPTLLTIGGAVYIKAQTIVPGTVPSPAIVNAGKVYEASLNSHHIYISKGELPITLVKDIGSALPPCTVYLDYESTEIQEVTGHYHAVEGTDPKRSPYVYLTDFAITIKLPDKSITFAEIASARGRYETKQISTIKPVWLSSRNVFIITNDQKSFRLSATAFNDNTYEHKIGINTFKSNDYLVPRSGLYIFNSPGIPVEIPLRPIPQRINIPSGPHTRIYQLLGQASKYETHLTDNARLHLSTPDALTKKSDASTWTLYTSQMETPVTYDDILLKGNILHVGNVIVELPPDNDTTVPMDSIGVATTRGTIYEVNRIFDQMVLFLIDASYYFDLNAILEVIRKHKDSGELAHEIKFENLRHMQIAGNVYYNSTNDFWGIETNRAYRFKPEDLVIEKF